MIDWARFFGFIMVLASAVGVVVFSIQKIRNKYPPVLRRIDAITKLRRAMGLSVEDGSRVHISLGNADVNDPSNASALVGLSTLHRLGQLSSTSDLPPLTTAGNGSFSLLAKDVLKRVSIETNTRELFDPDHAKLTGISPLGYAAGTLIEMKDPEVKANLFIGNFGPEVGFLTNRSEKNGAFTLGASDSLTGQAVLLASSQEVLIGEELYAIPAYLAYHPSHLASLRIEDYLRIIIGISLLASALLKVFGLL